MKKKAWKPEQLKCIQLLSHPETSKTYQEIAEECGISYNSLWNWRQDPDFIAEVNKLSYELLKGELPGAYKALSKKAKAGDTKAIELLLKFADNFVEKSEAKVTTDLVFNVCISSDDDDDEEDV